MDKIQTLRAIDSLLAALRAEEELSQIKTAAAIATLTREIEHEDYSRDFNGDHVRYCELLRRVRNGAYGYCRLVENLYDLGNAEAALTDLLIGFPHSE